MNSALETSRTTYQAWKWNGQNYNTICTGEYEDLSDLESHIYTLGWDCYVVERTDWGSTNEEDVPINSAIVLRFGEEETI